MKLNGGRCVGNTLPPLSTIPPNCWGGKRVRMGRCVITCRPVVVALHPPLLSTKTPGNDDARHRSPSSSSPFPAFYPHSHSHPPRPSFPTIPTSCCFHSVVTWRWWRSMWGAFNVWAVVVMWRCRWVLLASSAAGDMAWLAALAWRRRPSSLALLGASDMVSVGGVVGGIWGP